jgi:predicted aconitase with swiveling domain
VVELVRGHARGKALVLDEPLSFWGGLDPETGEIIDRRHPQSGAMVTGRILVMASGRGSSSSSYVLAEAIRAGTAPGGIVLYEPDGIVALGAIVAEELYARTIPVVVVSKAMLKGVTDGIEIVIDGATIESSGEVVEGPGPA